MSQKDPVSRSQLRAIQYWYMDGIFEFGFGLLCLAIGIYFIIGNMLQGNRFAFLVDIALVVVIIGGSFLMRWLVQRWKERFTFPRTGYVNYSRKGNRSQTIVMGMIVLGALGLMVLFLSCVEIQISTWPIVTSVLYGIVLSIVGWRTSLRRFHLHAFLSVLTGVGWHSALGMTT